MNDAQAIKLALEGRKEGFNAIFANHASCLYTHALRITKNQQTAEDAVQETFTAAWRFLPSFKGESKLRTWLYRILFNNSLKLIKKEKQPDASSFELVEQSSTNQSLLKIDVARSLDKLPEADRTVLMLAYWDELPIAEIAQILSKSETNVKVMLFRARQKFAKIWDSKKGSESNEM